MANGSRDIGNGLSNAVLPNADEEDPGGEPSGGLLSGNAATTAGLTDDNIAAEAGALGSLADQAGSGTGTSASTGATLGLGGGTGPAATASPGGDGRR